MHYTIPLFDLNFDSKEEEAVLEVIRSKWISTGPKVVELEQKFSGMLKVKHSVATSNCTVSLHLALIVIGIKPGDQVICPSLTFVATVNAIRYLNAVPVFADIKSSEDMTIDPGEISRLITAKTKAIIVMHYGGFACDMDQILEIADKHNLSVIEDACHAPMAEYKGKKLGTIGDIGCFSFYSNKNISTGEGGMLVTNNQEYADRVRLLRSHGMTTLSYERSKGHATSYNVVELGYNYRMDDMRAAIGIVQLDKLLPDLERRAEIRKWYIERFADCGEILIPFKEYKWFSSNYVFPIVINNQGLKKRDQIRDHLAKAGIQTSVHYPAVHRFLIYSGSCGNLPVTEYITDNLITLPMYSRLDKNQIFFISDTILQFMQVKTRLQV
jgi:dTDP-4-amino-4,6-dideoxygalactose transaminase